MQWVRGLVIGMIALSFSAGAASAASFNCKKARTNTERAICGNRAVSALDSEMASLYKQAQKLSCRGKQAVRNDQLAFLGGRNGCGADVGCLRNAYNDRISELLQEIDESEGGSCQ